VEPVLAGRIATRGLRRASCPLVLSGHRGEHQLADLPGGLDLGDHVGAVEDEVEGRAARLDVGDEELGGAGRPAAAAASCICAIACP
jgi:hypothetical protein